MGLAGLVKSSLEKAALCAAACL